MFYLGFLVLSVYVSDIEFFLYIYNLLGFEGVVVYKLGFLFFYSLYYGSGDRYRK